MTEQAEQAMVTLTLSPDEFGTLLGCVSSAAERSTDGNQRVTFMELSDSLRDAQRDMLGPMSVAEGMGIVREIQDTERATIVSLREP